MIALIDQLTQFSRDKGMAVVLSGPSGVGKDTVLSRFLPDWPSCTRLVTVTTRPKRSNEVDGVDYTFVTDERFEELKQQGGMLEDAIVYGYHYGSPRAYVEEKTAEGFDVILKLDVQGGLSVKRALRSCIMVFLAPPSYEELERRLRERRSETPEQLARRINNAHLEMGLIPEYQYLIVNHCPEQASRELGAIIQAERNRIVTHQLSSRNLSGCTSKI